MNERRAKRPEIVAELSGNHEGSLERELMLMDLAAASGADAVKIQTYTEDSLTLDCRRSEFMISGGLWKGQSLYELYKKAKTPREWMQPLFNHARECGIALFSSPFGPEDFEALEASDCPRYKIASFELNWPQFIRLCAEAKKPMVISTGLASIEEVDRAVEAALAGGCTDLTLLHCESRYPAEVSRFNLRTIPFFKKRYGCKAGLSNHALGDAADLAATALGADMIEKHFTDDRSRGSVDVAFSMTPEDLKTLARDTAAVAAGLGEETLPVRADEEGDRLGRRSVYLVKPLKAGEVLREEDVKVVRPGLGLPPYLLPQVLGKKAKHDLEGMIPLNPADFE